MNEHTIRQSMPMPRKDDVMYRMAGCRWYSCFGLRSGYYQIRMRERDIPLADFQIPDSLFEYLAVPMGLADMGATYIDDIYVFTRHEDIKVHPKAVEKVFQRCLDRNPVSEAGAIDNTVPKTVKDLQSFLGTTVYVQRICQNYLEISDSLFNSVKPKAKVVMWTPGADEALALLKLRFSTRPCKRYLVFSTFSFAY
ncbi:Hypothetical protein PHPALM_19872 [Phytophthora palmivora]|uniref:Reverse transcriptase n=1 Tax=Phytophthora palmivora TaxID=4796 RepID=A0A2P4XGA9_9STRA|nr:Hypothetical protein PHPALM_19872 [Phytophthora palmivora]